MNLSRQLGKLGGSSFSHPWQVLSAWIIVLGLLGFLAAQFMQPMSTAISIPGTEAQQAIDQTSELFPEASGGTARVVFHATGDATIADQRDAVESSIEKLNSIDGVEMAVSPFVDDRFISESGTIAYSTLQMKERLGSISEDTIHAINEAAEETRSGVLDVEVGGDVSQSVPEIIGIGEIFGVLIAMAVLIITLGSLIAGGMPIISALFAVGVSIAGLFSLSQVIDINSTTPVLAIMLGLAVGIDYALFIVSKYRGYVLSGYDNREAASRALATAGNAVVFAAITVIIALSALSVVNVPFMTIMGLAGAASIAVAAVAALTIIPALLGLAGQRVFGKKVRKQVIKSQKANSAKTAHIDKKSIWYRWGSQLVKRPITFLLLGIIVAGAIALPARDLTLGLPSDQFAAEGTTERKAYDLLSEGFGDGFNGPLLVVVDSLPKVSDAEEEAIRAPAMQQLNQRIEDETAAFQQRLSQASSPQELMALQEQALIAQSQAERQKQAAITEIEKQVQQFAKYIQLNQVAENISALGNVAQVIPAAVTDDGTAGLIQVIPSSAPQDEATSTLIQELRSEETQQELSRASDVHYGVTGSVALQGDINVKLANALPIYLMVVVGLSLVLLVIAFRSLLIPLKATLGFLLSVAAMFGALVAVFQWGWFGLADAPGPIVSFVPIIAVGILFGLAMDYEFFLVSNMHESYEHTKKAKQSIVDGFSLGGKVVVAAALIMISVFGAFITNHETVIASIGFALAIGILVDAFIVRMTIVPAVMSLLGSTAWWLPKWLVKILPRISIEGEVTKK